MLGKEAMPPVLIGLTKGAVPRFGTTPFVEGEPGGGSNV